MNDNDQTDAENTTFEKVESIMNQMVLNGVTPTIRAVREQARCSQATAIRLFDDVKEKQRQELVKNADEFGSSEIGKLLAAELNNMVLRRNEKSQQIIDDLRTQVKELNDLFKEHEESCESKISIANVRAEKAIVEADERANKAIERADKAEADKVEAIKQAEQQISVVKKDYEIAVTESRVLVEVAKKEADALVQASDKRLAISESELADLREQIKQFTVSEAKHLLEKEHFEQGKEKISSLQDELSNAKTDIVKLNTENNNHKNNIDRLNSELSDAKNQISKSADAQILLIESQKQVQQLTHDLNQSEKERESLSQALAASSSKS